MKTRVMQNESDHPRNNEQESRVAQIPALCMAAIYEWADHPHERVSLMRVRAGITDHAQAPPFPRAPTPFAEKPGQAPDR